MGSLVYTIKPYETAFGAELGICHEWRNSPSRHNAHYVVSHPAWTQARGLCKAHLEKIAHEDSNLRAAWERTKKAALISVAPY